MLLVCTTFKENYENQEPQEVSLGEAILSGLQIGAKAVFDTIHGLIAPPVY
jgi:hypothetical protein